MNNRARLINAARRGERLTEASETARAKARVKGGSDTLLSKIAKVMKRFGWSHSVNNGVVTMQGPAKRWSKIYRNLFATADPDLVLIGREESQDEEASELAGRFSQNEDEPDMDGGDIESEDDLYVPIIRTRRTTRFRGRGGSVSVPEPMNPPGVESEEESDEDEEDCGLPHESRQTQRSAEEGPEPRVGDRVQLLTGKHKGKSGRVIEIDDEGGVEVEVAGISEPVSQWLSNTKKEGVNEDGKQYSFNLTLKDFHRQDDILAQVTTGPIYTVTATMSREGAPTKGVNFELYPGKWYGDEMGWITKVLDAIRAAGGSSKAISSQASIPVSLSRGEYKYFLARTRANRARLREDGEGRHYTVTVKYLDGQGYTQRKPLRIYGTSKADAKRSALAQLSGQGITTLGATVKESADLRESEIQVAGLDAKSRVLLQRAAASYSCRIVSTTSGKATIKCLSKRSHDLIHRFLTRNGYELSEAAIKEGIWDLTVELESTSGANRKQTFTGIKASDQREAAQQLQAVIGDEGRKIVRVISATQVR